MLQRAAVLIGVKKTGGLPVLRAVHDGVQQMKAWAVAQPGMLDLDAIPRVEVLSDHDGTEVTATAVRKAISRYVDDGTVEQLFVYFAGHGANVRYGEYWLLSGAPSDPNEAVNVEASITLARQCGIPHVVLMSDACRTAAASIQSQAVQGAIVFPNKGPRRKPGHVDVFYATLVGEAALEVSDPDAPERFDAVYTIGLLQGLGGAAKAETEQDSGKPVRRVRPWPLERYLSAAIPDLLAARRVGLSVTQTPHAIITSAPEAWLSQLDPAADSTEPGEPVRDPRGGATRRVPMRDRSTESQPVEESVEHPVAESPVESLATVSQRALQAALSGDSAPARARRSPSRARGPARGTRRGARATGPGASTMLFTEVFDRTGTELGPRLYESKCGFKVEGTAVASVIAGSGSVELLSAQDGLVRLWDVRPPATNALIVFGDGRGALIPAIPDFIAVLTYENGQIANVVYEPSENSDRWREVEPQLAELRALRRVVATSARLGVFRPDTLAAQEGLIDRLRRAKGLDPTMAIYAAYALHALQKRSEIEDMEVYLHAGLGLTLFDVAMLARQPGGDETWNVRNVFPAVPLLSRGWALLDAYGVELAPSLAAASLHRYLQSSLWTLLDARGVDVLRAAIMSGEIE